MAYKCGRGRQNRGPPEGLTTVTLRTKGRGSSSQWNRWPLARSSMHSRSGRLWEKKWSKRDEGIVVPHRKVGLLVALVPSSVLERLVSTSCTARPSYVMRNPAWVPEVSASNGARQDDLGSWSLGGWNTEAVKGEVKEALKRRIQCGRAR